MKRTMPVIRPLRLLSDAHCHIRLSTSGCGEPTRYGDGRGIDEDAADKDLQNSEGKLGRTARQPRLRLRRAVLCGTHPQIDWALLEQLAESSAELRLSSSVPCANHSSGSPLSESGRATNNRDGTDILVGFGVHPWFVPEVGDKEERCTGKDSDTSAQSVKTKLCATAPILHDPVTQQQSHLDCSLSLILEELERLLRVFPRAIVGEIGLDKIRGPCESTQVAAFLAQMKLAAQYHRPVSVHCVRHYGLLLQLLQELPAKDIPPAIILHGFTGSFSIAQSLLKLKPKKFPKGSNKETVRIADRLFFSVGSQTSGTLKDFVDRTLPLLCKPKKRILFESDLHYQVCAHSTLSALTQEGDGSSRKPQPFLPLQCLDVSNAASILTSLEQMLDTISASLVSSGRESSQGNMVDLAPNEEVVDFLEDVFDDAFAVVL